MNHTWYGFLDSESPAVIAAYTPILEDFLVRDNLDKKKFLANYRILENESRELYKSSANLLDDEDLSDFGTKNIDSLASSFSRPVGYPNWFIAGYPDVVVWGTELAEKDSKTIESIIDATSPNDVIDSDHHFKPLYLRKIIEAYKLEHELECVA